MPRVSVLMPTHNRADIIGLAIQSVLDQTETDFELLIVADGCTDDTCEVVAAVGDPRIRICDLPKAPRFGYANRNVALREARGTLVAFAADDDLLFPDHLTLLCNAFTSPRVEWAYSRPLWVSTDGIVVPFGTNLTHADELEEFLTARNTIPSSCIVYRQSCLDRYGYYPEDVRLAADWEQAKRIIAGGGRTNISYVTTPTCLHFSASWRASRFSDTKEVRTWLEIADASAWWPAALSYAIPDGMPEQAVIAAHLRSGGDVWVRAVRSAIGCVIDRVMWDDIRLARPRLLQLEVELSKLRAQVEMQ